MVDVRTPPANAPRPWDFLLTGFFIIIELLLAVVFVLSALTLGAINTGCSGCDETMLRFGLLLCLYVPPAIALVTIVWAIVRVLRRRIGFWVALLGAALMTLAFFGGSALVTLGNPTL
jgi:uncharacterized BrkB/YihY/UPF0761 family membrane protein